MLLEHPKLSNVMARALHQPIVPLVQGHKQQEEEEVDKMMQQKIKKNRREGRRRWKRECHGKRPRDKS